MLDYYRDSATRELVKRHFDIVVDRVNAYSGVRYGDDPTIMAWDVMNEPRCPGETRMRSIAQKQRGTLVSTSSLPPHTPLSPQWPPSHVQAPPNEVRVRFEPPALLFSSTSVGCTPEEMTVKLNWLKEMASYLRSIDSKHLITQVRPPIATPMHAVSVHQRRASISVGVGRPMGQRALPIDC